MKLFFSIVLLLLGFASLPAEAVVLNFNGAICGGAACTNGDKIDQSYGDQPNLDVIYVRACCNSGSGGLDGRLSYWSTGYSDLVNVAWALLVNASPAGIFLKPADGYQVTLNGFDLGAYPNEDRSSQFVIFGGDATAVSNAPVLFKLGEFPNFIDVSGQTASKFVFSSLTSSDGIFIKWGPSATNVGIDNINFVVTPVEAVPEPSTVGLLLLGLAGLAWGARRRA